MTAATSALLRPQSAPRRTPLSISPRRTGCRAPVLHPLPAPACPRSASTAWSLAKAVIRALVTDYRRCPLLISSIAIKRAPDGPSPESGTRTVQFLGYDRPEASKREHVAHPFARYRSRACGEASRSCAWASLSPSSSQPAWATDLVFPRYRLALFVHGCFWHRHTGYPNCTMQKTRADFWLAKFTANIARDRR